MARTRVLVVEDSATVRGRLLEIVRSDPTLELVGEADDGKRAIELCERCRPDVITMDMMLPVMSGLAATEYIMAHCPTPILVVSASTNRGDYCISKTGLGMLTQLFALRLADPGIRVFEVRPGVIETDMTAAVREKYVRQIEEGLTPIRRMGTPEDVGKAVALLATGALPYSTGDVLNVDGGYHVRRL